MKQLILVTFLCTFCGCGTMLAGTREEVIITSVPPGVEVLVDGQAHTTPANLMLERRENHTVRFPNGQVVKIEKTFLGNGEHWLNAFWILPGIIPALVANIIDMATGCADDLEPDVLEYREDKVYNEETGQEILGK